MKSINCHTFPPNVKGFVYSVLVTCKPHFQKAFEHVPNGNNLKITLFRSVLSSLVFLGF